MSGLSDWFVDVTQRQRGHSRAVNAENPHGEKGKGGMAAGPLGPCRKGSPCLKMIQPGETVPLMDVEGTGIIRHIWVTVDLKTTDAEPFILRDLILRMYWDDEGSPSVEVPLGDFFCCGFGRSCVFQSIPVCVAPARGMNAYFPMPFRKHALITLESQHPNPIPAFFYQIDYVLVPQLSDDIVSFHASWRREKCTHLTQDYTIIDQIKGYGHYVGTYIGLTALERYWWGEGELKFFIDGDDQYPTICGTGMEDYFGGAWSFAVTHNGIMAEKNFAMPQFGYPYYSRDDELVVNPYHNTDCLPMRGFYRWHLSDPILFEKDMRVTLQQIGTSHNGLFERQDDLCSVAYWYQSEPHQAFLPLPLRKDRLPR